MLKERVVMASLDESINKNSVIQSSASDFSRFSLRSNMNRLKRLPFLLASIFSVIFQLISFWKVLFRSMKFSFHSICGLMNDFRLEISRFWFEMKDLNTSRKLAKLSVLDWGEKLGSRRAFGLKNEIVYAKKKIF